MTPGVLLRLGANSEVRMVSPSLTDTRVEVLHGEAMVEATDVHKENNIRILDHGATTTLVKNGLYDFDANTPRVSVYDGKVTVQGNDNTVHLGKGKQVLLAAGPLKAVHFDRNQRDDLYAWSSLRSGYLSEASVQTVQAYGGSPYWNGWYGPGWYWDPFFPGYSFIPGAGFLYSPFGFGFYSPVVIYRHGYFRSGGGVAPVRGVFRGTSTGPVVRGSFRGGGFGGGGFRGGFHGGGARR